MKHTPGPWKILKLTKGNLGSCPSQVISMGGGHSCRVSSFDDKIVISNARLIAAAPELLELCQAMFLWLQAEEKKGYPKESMATYFVPNILKSARAALAKAQGE